MAYNRVLPLFNSLLRGLKLNLPNATRTYSINWHSEDEKQFLEYILKAITNYLNQLLYFHANLQNKLPNSFYTNVLTFSLFTIIYTNFSLFTKFKKDPDFQLNRYHYISLSRTVQNVIFKSFSEINVPYTFKDYMNSREFQIFTAMTIDNPKLKEIFLTQINKLFKN